MSLFSLISLFWFIWCLFENVSLRILVLTRSPEVFFARKCSSVGVIRNFAKFKAKHLFQSLFFKRLWPATLLKKSLWHRCFPANFAKFLRTLFSQNNSGRLLLTINGVLAFGCRHWGPRKHFQERNGQVLPGNEKLLKGFIFLSVFPQFKQSGLLSHSSSDFVFYPENTLENGKNIVFH